MKRTFFAFASLASFFLAACAHQPAGPRELSSSSGLSSLPEGSPFLGAKPFDGPHALAVPGIDRVPAKVYLPLQYQDKEKWPLVVLLHGFSGTSEAEDAYLTLRFRVSSRGFILATPDGTVTPANTKTPDGRDLGGNQFWNATDFCCDFAKTGVDDTTYLRRLVETLSREYRVDPKRIYLFGHSNGGFMANRLACEMGDQIAAIADLAGGSFKDPQACRAPRPIPYLQIHAVDDPTISFKPVAGYAGGQETVEQWGARNGCRGNPADGPAKDYVFLIPGQDTKPKLWQNCASGKEVALWEIRPYETKGHNAHIPLFHLSFTDDVLSFLLSH